METYARQLLDTLDEIEGNGSFVISGTKSFIPLGLTVKGVSEISFPISSLQIDALKKAAHKAPFGKGSQTIVDANVRSAWEIDAPDISFLNKDFHKLIDELLETTKVGLGLGQQTITANLYKLLIYEAGDFFLPHKDSEKEAGMFGTLIVGLPSKHTGGQLFVRFDGNEEIVDFSDSDNDYKIPFTAFFADCEHEIKPITSGHRVCLVYNLVQIGKGQAPIQHTETSEIIRDLADILRQANTETPFAVLLGHEYTPTNFSMEALKHHDYPRAEALMEAAEAAGFYAKLGLVTSYMMGDLEIEYSRSSRRSRRSYYDIDDDEATENGTMGSEIHEAYIHVEHWSADDDLPPLSTLDLDEDDIISDLDMGEGEPTEKQAEGYTGNAGMTIEYWYHYGAIVLWHKSKHFDLLHRQEIKTKLAWLTYYLKNWATADREAIKKLIVHFNERDLRDTYNPPDFSVVVAILIQLKDEKFIKSETCQSFLVQVFDKINVEQWSQLVNAFDVALFPPIFKKAAASDKIEYIKHITGILDALQKMDAQKTNPFLMESLAHIPTYLNTHVLDKDDNNKHALPIVDNLLRLSALKNEDEKWLEDTTQSLVKSMVRKYVNEVLVHTLLASNSNKEGHLAKRLFKVCQEDLIKRTITKPTPPANWTREVPKGTPITRHWGILKPFLESPTQRVFDFARPQDERSAMASTIRNVTIDLEMETIKKGSPHTLRLTKTQAAFDNDLKRWHVDVALLSKLEAFFGASK